MDFYVNKIYFNFYIRHSYPLIDS